MSKHYLDALQQAANYYERRAFLSKEDKYNAIVALAEWHLFSNRQIASFIGASAATVNGVTGKTLRTGGRLKPQALRPVIEVIHMRVRGEIDKPLVRAAVKSGVSVNMLAKLTGIPQRTVARWVGPGEVVLLRVEHDEVAA